jgi:hypothetical protein
LIYKNFNIVKTETKKAIGMPITITVKITVSNQFGCIHEKFIILVGAQIED